MRTSWSLAIVVGLLVLPTSGCAQLNKLKVENAELRAKLGCCGEEKARLVAEIGRQQELTDAATQELVSANVKLADASGRAAGQRARADALAASLEHAQEQVTELQRQIEQLIAALEKAWARKRGRSLVDDLVRLKRVGADFTVDACTDCGGETAGH